MLMLQLHTIGERKVLKRELAEHLEDCVWRENIKELCAQIYLILRLCLQFCHMAQACLGFLASSRANIAVQV